MWKRDSNLNLTWIDNGEFRNEKLGKKELKNKIISELPFHSDKFLVHQYPEVKKYWKHPTQTLCSWRKTYLPDCKRTRVRASENRLKIRELKPVAIELMKQGKNNVEIAKELELEKYSKGPEKLLSYWRMEAGLPKLKNIPKKSELINTQSVNAL